MKPSEVLAFYAGLESSSYDKAREALPLAIAQENVVEKAKRLQKAGYMQLNSELEALNKLENGDG